LFISKIVRVLPTVIKKGSTKARTPTPQELVEEEPKREIVYTPDELEFIIKTLGEQTFKIKEIEFIYTLIVKLQEDYLKQTKKK
jgi:tRNA1(Val) A37 N6-methylase TrmN6